MYFKYFTALQGDEIQSQLSRTSIRYTNVTRLTRECRNIIQHTAVLCNVATAQNYNSRKFGLKM